MLLSGELAASFGHDVFNKITALELEARNLTGANLTDKSTRPQTILELVLDLKNTVHAFQQMLDVKEKMELVDLNYTIERAVILLRDLAQKRARENCKKHDSRTPKCNWKSNIFATGFSEYNVKRYPANVTKGQNV